MQYRIYADAACGQSLFFGQTVALLTPETHGKIVSPPKPKPKNSFKSATHCAVWRKIVSLEKAKPRLPWFDLMSKEETKKDRERYFFKRFQELMKEGITDIRPSENPDFIAQLDGKKIGIEHTEIFQDSHLGKGSQLKKRQAIRKKLGDTIVCELEKVIRIPFQLSIRFSYHYELGNNQVQETALRIIKAIFEKADIFLQKHELIIDAMEGFKDRLIKRLA